MKDGWAKNTLKRIVKKAHQGQYERYVREIRERSDDIPPFSLFSSDCMAGLIYHTMGRQFLSPTINMSIKDRGFLKLMSDMEYYFDQEIEYTEWTKYPIGFIGEGDRRIEIRFEHYHSNEEATVKWNDRKQRIVGNRFIIMADQDLTDAEIDQFRHLQCTRKVMFTWNADRADGSWSNLITNP